VAVAIASVQDEPARRAIVRRLRVAQVVTKFTAGAGGIAMEGARALDPERYRVSILTAEGGSLTAEAREAGLDVVGLRHMAPDLSPSSDARGVRELASRLADGHFDVVHTHSAKAGALGRMAARQAGVPVVVHTLHGFPFHRFQSRLRRYAYMTAERRLAGITDYFLASGSEVAAEAVRLKIAPPDRIRAFETVPIGAHVLEATEENRRRARGLLGLPLEAKVVGTAARLDAQKSPLDMVRAFAALPRRDVYMAWLGDGELRPETERLIARHGLRDRFLLLGHRTDVPELLPAFDLFALSSLYEGLPCALVEAMVCGIPVVATAVNAIPEIVIPGKTGLLVRPGDPASLSRALGHLLDRPAEGQRMAAAARAQLGERFAPAALGRDFAEVYDLALGLRLSPLAATAGLEAA
jgi:glycosyltransferase involved in cell wall biosynthesis